MKYKQVLVVRKDLKMSKGKTAVQVAHGAIGAMLDTDGFTVSAWLQEGGKKVVVAVEDEAVIKNLIELANEHELPMYVVRDFGLTELEPDTLTVLGIGPATNARIDPVTSQLKML